MAGVSSPAKSKSKTLKFRGSTLNPQTAIGGEQRAKLYLDAAPADEVFSTPDIIAACGLCESSATWLKGKLPEYHHRVGTRVYWGSKAAIRELKRQTESVSE